MFCLALLKRLYGKKKLIKWDGVGETRETPCSYLAVFHPQQSLPFSAVAQCRFAHEEQGRGSRFKVCLSCFPPPDARAEHVRSALSILLTTASPAAQHPLGNVGSVSTGPRSPFRSPGLFSERRTSP